MRFLLDENISPKTAEFLRSLGVDAIHAIEAKLKGKSDPELYEYCKSKKRVLVTFDHEFGFEYLSRKDLQGLVIVRIHPQTLENLHPILKNFFMEVKKGRIEVKHRIVVVENDRIRIRKVVA